MLDLVITDKKNYINSDIDRDALYFIEDQLEIYLDGKCYTKSIFFVDDFPDLMVKDKIYIKKTTLEIKLYDGEKVLPIRPRIYTALQDGVVCEGLVTGNAIKSYVSNRFINFEKKFGKIDKLDTDNVTLSKDIIVNQKIGSYKPGDQISTGEKLTNILTKILVCIENPEYIPPTLTIRPDSQIYELGEIISPLITAEFEKNDAGELKRYSLDKIDHDGSINTVITDTKVIDYHTGPFMVTDKLIKYKASVEFNEGNIKENNIQELYPDGRIPAGNLESSMTIQGKRKLFYGTRQDKKEVTNDIIRELNNSILDPKKDIEFDLNIKKGDIQLIIAYPEYLPDIKRIYSTELKLDVLEVFDYNIIEVEGANKYKPIKYKVYTYSGDISYINDDIYKISI